MSNIAKVRAEALAERPHIRKWIKRFQKLALDMPPEVWVFVASRPYVMALDENGRIYETNGGCMDQDAILSGLDVTSKGQWDGGDW